MNEQFTVLRGNEAQAVLDNPAYQAAMKLLKEQIATEWLNAPIRDKEGQLLLLQLAKLCHKFEGIFNGMVAEGTMAKHKLDLDKIRDEPPVRQFMRRVISG
jgi:predicted transcriptional regulator